MTKKRTRIRTNSFVVIWALMSLVLVLAVAMLLLIREYIVQEDYQPTSKLYLDETPHD